MTNVHDPQDYLDDVEAPARPQQKLWVSNWSLGSERNCGCLIGPWLWVSNSSSSLPFDLAVTIFAPRAWKAYELVPEQYQKSPP